MTFAKLAQRLRSVRLWLREQSGRRRFGAQAPDRWYLLTAGLLLLIGLLMLTSAGSVIGYQKFGDSYYFLKRQLLNGLLPGLLGAWLTMRLDYRLWRRLARPLLLLAVALLVAVFIPGIGAQLKGAYRWLNLGGFLFQPSELVKLLLIMSLAAWLERRADGDLATYRRGLLPFTLLLGLVSGLVVAQPDLGTAVVLVGIAVAMHFTAGAPPRHLLLLGSAGLAAVVTLAKLEPYRLNRLTAFFNPSHDPQGIGYHISQALIAVGSGGWFGVGWGQSLQKFNYLPEATGDSLFAVLAEELGFLLTISVVVLIGYLVYRGLLIAYRAPDQYGRLLAVGVTCWLGLQSLINLAANIGLLPFTGIPLPFFSYGSTALAVNLTAVGLVAGISRWRR